MGDIAIRVEHLSKLYRIGPREPYKALRDTLTAAIYAPFRAVSAFLSGRRSAVQNSPSNSYVWALKDVSFEVKRGEVVGIIGRNGAGKTTLLKILSRVTEPTEGYAEIHGRVGSLLEVGTGFHPELTGRENIYLSGIILGMKKAEIDRKFDEIVAFAEIEKFLDTPVKYYSSGMYVRLAFAVAAHLEPEILLVDEVLAVGDAAFQKKCLGKMGDVAKEGRTVLFVSHNMAAIEHLCPRTILLDKGHMIKDGPTKDTIRSYMQLPLEFDLRKQDLSDFLSRRGSGEIRIINVSLRDRNDEPIAVAKCGEPLKIVLSFVKTDPDFNRSVYVSIFCKTVIGAPVFLHHNRMAGVHFGNLPERGEFICEIPFLNLIPDIYRLTITILAQTDYIDIIEDAFELSVEAGEYLGQGELPPPSFGPCVIKANWSVRRLDT